MKKIKKPSKSRQPHMDDRLRKNTYFRSSESPLKRSELSKKVASESKKREPRSSKRSSNKKAKIKASNAVTVIIVFSFLSVILYASSVSSKGSVASLNSDSYSFRDVAEYESFIDRYISDHPLARSKLLFPVSEFNEAFIDEYPEVTEIKTKVPFADRNIQVSIMTPEPLFRVAGVSSDGDVKYIDANGTVISSSSSRLDPAIPTLTVDSSVFTEVGSQLLTSNELEILTLINKEITDDEIENLPGNFTVSQADLDISNGRIEIGFRGIDYIVRFSAYSDARTQVGSLKAILTELYNAGEEKGLPREYIDVRVFEKVFIK